MNNSSPGFRVNFWIKHLSVPSNLHFRLKRTQGEVKFRLKMQFKKILQQ